MGSVAVDIFAQRGFEVVAITGKLDQFDFLKAIGATQVLLRDEFLADGSRLVKTPAFAAALDNVGGQMLDRLMANMLPHGKIAISGMITADLQTTVLPFVLRSVDVLGVNCSRQLKMPERIRLWQRLGSDLRPHHFDSIARPIAFGDLDRAMDRFFEVSSVGRVVVEVGERAPVAA